MGVVCLVLLAVDPRGVAGGRRVGGGRRARRRAPGAVSPSFRLSGWRRSTPAPFVYGGFPWNLTRARALPASRLAADRVDLGRLSASAALVVAVSALLAAAGCRRRATALVAAAAALVLAAGALGRGAAARRRDARSGARDARGRAAPAERLTRRRGRLGGRGRGLRDGDRAGARGRGRGRRTSLVIPESAFPIVLGPEPAPPAGPLEPSPRACGGLVLFNDVEELPDGRYFNVARLLGPAGLVGAPYRKVHLVPFGEYVPLPKLFFFVAADLDGDRRVLGGGRARRRCAMPAGSRSASASATRSLSAASFGEEVARLGANLLVTISNDSWYGRAGAQEQHFAGAVLRAVENERYLLRAAITGISGIVDERGRIVGELDARAPRNRSAARVASPGRSGRRGRAGGTGCRGWRMPSRRGVLLFGLARWWPPGLAGASRGHRRSPS